MKAKIPETSSTNRSYRACPPPLLSLVKPASTSIQALLPVPPDASAALAPAQRDMLLGVFSLGDTTVAEIMTPRLDIAAVESGASWSEVLDLFRRREHVRVPVYTDGLDNIIDDAAALRHWLRDHAS